MKCRTVAKELPAYLANELSERARSRVEKHLKHCALCTAELRALERTDQLLGTLDQVEPRRDLVGHVMRHIEREQETIPAFKRFLTSLRERQPQLQHAAAYILLAGALVLMAYNYQARRRSAAMHTAPGLTGPDGKTAEVSSPDVGGSRLAKPIRAVSTSQPEQKASRYRLTTELLDDINRGFEQARRRATDDEGSRLPEAEGVIRPVGTPDAPGTPASE